MTIADLPAPTTKRWNFRRKAEVVAAVCGGLLSLEEARRRYALTIDEFLSWQYSIKQYGLSGLPGPRPTATASFAFSTVAAQLSTYLGPATVRGFLRRLRISRNKKAPAFRRISGHVNTPSKIRDVNFIAPALHRSHTGLIL